MPKVRVDILCFHARLETRLERGAWGLRWRIFVEMGCGMEASIILNHALNHVCKGKAPVDGRLGRGSFVVSS